MTRKELEGQLLNLIVDREKFIAHVKRICCSNIRVPCKICLACPFKKYVLQIMREKGWKLPKKSQKQKRG